MKKAILEITLKSDLCVGSGYSYAGVIDSDSVYDRYGLPCIPGRRIKGCLREASRGISCVLEHNETDIFGGRGKKRTGALIVDNAHLKNYDDIVSRIGGLDIPESISRMFSYVRAQTSMDENGLAKEESLRLTRVVNHYFPYSSDENVFQAEIEFYDDIEEDLKKIAAATRQIGMHRRRGLGVVKCEIKNIEDIQNVIPDPASGENIVRVPYTLYSEEPLIISNGSDASSETYISGRVMLGTLAGRFLDSGRSADSEEFKDLFLNGRTVFSNAYMTVQGRRSVPVPLFVQRLKKSKKLVNVEEQQSYPVGDTSEYNPANGNQPKKLTGKYLTINKEGAFGIGEVQTKIVYHHRHEHDIEALLYSQTVIDEGQAFSGYICTPKKYADMVKALLGKEIRVGKSKTAQYGKCSVKILNDEENAPVYELKKGEIIAVALDSDAIINNENGNTTDFNEVYESIATELGLESMEVDNEMYSIVETGLSFAYQTVWNLHRKPLAVVKAGSVFTYRVDKDMSVDRFFIGKKNLEGFGEISIYHMDDLSYKLSEYDTDQSDTENLEVNDNDFSKALEKEKRVRVKKLSIQQDVNGLLGISPAALGRVTLMLREAINGHRGNEIEIYDDFMSRVNSIKTTATQDKVRKFVEKVGIPDRDSSILDCWSDIMLTGLTYKKYLNAGKGDNE